MQETFRVEILFDLVRKERVFRDKNNSLDYVLVNDLLQIYS